MERTTMWDIANTLLKMEPVKFCQMIGILEQELYHMNEVCDLLRLKKFSPRNTDTMIPDSEV